VPLLEAKGLVKSFRGRGTVVHGVSFRVEPGEIVGLLGPNGAGKTTSFRMTIGMIRADAGEVSFLGQEVNHLPMYRRARLGMGYLSQEPSVFRNLTVEENLLAILETLPVDRRRRRELLEEHLGELGLTHLRASLAHQLSGGERRRLEITRALVTSPKLLLLDEPFVGIDPKTVEEVQRNVTNLGRKGIGVLITDHQVRETLAITDRAYIIHAGRILAEGGSRDLVNDPVVRDAYLGERFRMPELDSEDGEADTRDEDDEAPGGPDAGPDGGAPSPPRRP
jgi:lipopolysaccharide export system ATP-binding protein